MTDLPEESGENLDKGRFKKGYDPRRWMKGAPKKPKDKKRAEELLEHVIWDVFSEELQNPKTGESIDRLRAMIRSMTTSRQSADKQALLDRIAGKIKQDLDVTSGGEKLTKVIIEHIGSQNPDTNLTQSADTNHE